MTAPGALDNFRLAEPIFVDANIFLFHAFADPQYGAAARSFLQRIEGREISAITSALVMNEVLFKITIQEAFGRLEHPNVWKVREELRRDIAFRTAVSVPVQQYTGYLVQLAKKGLSVVDITYADMVRSVDIGARHGLFITDATHVAIWQARGIPHVATNDRELWDIPGVTIWAP
jgi:predicted nucleic acid-binding protein